MVLVELVVGYVDHRSVGRLAQCNRRWAKLLVEKEREYVWRQLLKRDFGWPIPAGT